MTSLNSSITAAAGMLGVKPEELAVWLEQVNPSKGRRAEPQWQDLKEVEAEIEQIVTATNPLLAQRWRLVSLISKYHRR